MTKGIKNEEHERGKGYKHFLDSLCLSLVAAVTPKGEGEQPRMEQTKERTCLTIITQCNVVDTFPRVFP